MHVLYMFIYKRIEFRVTLGDKIIIIINHKNVPNNMNFSPHLIMVDASLYPILLEKKNLNNSMNCQHLIWRFIN